MYLQIWKRTSRCRGAWRRATNMGGALIAFLLWWGTYQTQFRGGKTFPGFPLHASPALMKAWGKTSKQNPCLLTSRCWPCFYCGQAMPLWAQFHHHKQMPAALWFQQGATLLPFLLRAHKLWLQGRKCFFATGVSRVFWDSVNLRALLDLGSLFG